MVLPPQLKLLAVFSRKLGHDSMSEQCNHPHTESRKYEHTQFHSGMDTHTQTDCAYIFLSLNPSSFRVVPNILLVMHVILPSHIVFLHSRHEHN